jgi:signal transduction histidine kinase
MKKKDFLTGAVLGIIGFCGNWFNVELFFDVNFLFGSFFVMFAILRYGTFSGIFSGIIAAICTYFLWHHPWAIIIFSVEAIFISLTNRRFKNRLITADILYWLILGSPMVWFFYHHVMEVQSQAAILIMLKQSLNGVFNSLLATLVLLFIKTVLPTREEPPPFRQLIFTAMVALVLIPSLFAITFNLKYELRKGTQRLIERTSAVSEQAQISLTNWLKEHEQPVITLAHMVRNSERGPSGAIQQMVETIRSSAPGMLRMGVFDRRAISRAYSPDKDDQGRSTIGIDFSDRPYIPVIRERVEPYVSDILPSKFVKASSFVAILVPLIGKNGYQGYCSGVVDTTQIRHLLIPFTTNNRAQLTILDRKGSVITSTREELKINNSFIHPAQIHGSHIGSGVTHWIPPPEKGTSIMQRWRKSTFEKRLDFAPYIGWTLVCETSILPLLQDLTQVTIYSLSLLAFLVICTVIIAEVTSRYLVSGIDLLKNFTQVPPQHFLDENQDLKWPTSRIMEVSSLIINFRQMADSLRCYFGEFLKVNAELEHRIEEQKHTEAELLEHQKKLEEMSMEISLAEVRERGHIAGELHDQVGQRMILTKIKLDSLINKISEPDLLNELYGINGLLQQSLKDVRTLTFQLRPPILANAGLEAAIEWLATEIQTDYGLKIDLETDKNPKHIPYEISSLLFQAVRELLLNIAKHAGTSSASVKIKKKDQSLVITVEDRGKGFNIEEIGARGIGKGGFGIFNIRQKIKYLGGQLILDSSPGSGTRVTIITPIGNSQGEINEFENHHSR